MNAFRSMTLPLFALVAALAGCSAEAGTSAGAESVDGVQSTASAEQAASVDSPAEHTARGPHFAAHHGGPDFLVHAALRAPINLTAEQKATIEGLLKSNAPAEPPAFDKTRASKLAAAIRSNTVSADVTDKPVVDETARQARIATSAKTLSTLHDTLTPEQRTALVDSLAKRAAEAKGEHGKRGGKTMAMRGHGEHAQRAGDEGGHFRGRGGPGGGPMGMLAGLELTQEQKDAIKAKLEAQRPEKPSEEQREAMKARFEAMRTEMKAKLEIFKSDKFDATAFVTPSQKLERPEHGGDRMAHLAAITSVLTPAQRETLAARIEQGPPAQLKAPHTMRTDMMKTAPIAK
jgi:Spy/CpxP family protein refolding chaperone